MSTKKDIGPKRIRHKASTEKFNERVTVPWTIRAPIYGAAVCLITLYGWGAFQSYPWPCAVALVGVFILGEFLKTPLGELVAEAIDLRDKGTTVLLLGACTAAICVGAFGGQGAINAAAAPRVAYDRAAKDLKDAQDALNALPVCTPDMPKVRCDALTTNNADAKRDRTEVRDAAKRVMDITPNPGPGIPESVTKFASFGALFIEFLIFVAPLSWTLLYRRRLARSAPPKPPEAPAPAPALPVPLPKAPLSASELARKGWEGEAGEKRRAAMRARYRQRVSA